MGDILGSSIELRTKIGREGDDRVGGKKHGILCRLADMKKASVVGQARTGRVAIQGEDKPTSYIFLSLPNNKTN